MNDDEYHIEKIINKSLDRKNNKWMYEVSWKGFDEKKMEPKENIPRILVELFDRFGDSTIKTEIHNYFEKFGIKYVNIEVSSKGIMTLPACSLEVDEDAYFLPTHGINNCNTEKIKSRFYHRTGGILVMGKPCGFLMNLAEIFGGESITQVAELIELSLENFDNDEVKCIVYDDACHLKRHVDNIHNNLVNKENGNNSERSVNNVNKDVSVCVIV